MIIEAVVLAYLKQKLNTDEVYMEIPEKLGGSFVTIQRVDASKRNLINAATLEIQAYAPTKYECALLDEQVREAMDNFAEEPEISASKFGGGNDSANTQIKKYRYRCYYNIYY